MSNFTFLAQNNEKDSYVKQACLLAMSIRATNRNSKICLITNDKVPTEYDHLFNDVVPIPFQDTAKHDKWKVQNRSCNSIRRNFCYGYRYVSVTRSFKLVEPNAKL